jgi:hypothetical protein
MKNVEYQAKLVHVKNELLYIKEPNEQLVASFDENLLQVGIGVKLSPSKQKSTLTFHLDVSYDYDIASEHPLRFIKFEGAFEFKISPFEENILLKGEDLNMDHQLLSSLLEISISTARGILLAKSAGGFLHKYYLPIINPSEIIQNMLK